MYPEGNLEVIGSREHEETVAHNLFAVLRDFDARKVDCIFSESFSKDQLGQAIHRNVLRIVSTLCLTETDNRDTVTDLHDFIQLMGDKYDCMSRLTELLQLFKQRLGLLRSQHGRRLIENDDLRIPVKCL